VRRLVAAIDFSPVSKAVVEQAASIAEAFSAEITLIHAAPPEPDFVGYEVDTKPIRDDRANEIRAEHRELQSMADALRARGIAARAILVQGPAVEKIVGEAERLDADAIVIGSHGHGAIYRALLGSISEGVLRAAKRPVLVVPATH